MGKQDGATASQEANFDVHQVTTFALSDEPGWYLGEYGIDGWNKGFFNARLYPPPALRSLWHSFLKQNNVTPADLGARKFDAVVQSFDRLSTSLVLRIAIQMPCVQCDFREITLKMQNEWGTAPEK